MQDQILKKYSIGLDIGTSSIKLIILNLTDGKIDLELKKSSLNARVENKSNPEYNEQNVDVILELVNLLLNELPDEYFSHVRGVQICGQMHGVVMWNTATKKHSNLITWQDKRCSQEFLADLPVKSVSDLNSGFGCATLLWLTKYTDIENLSMYNAAGTIQDYVTFSLSKAENVMSDHNALSWGYFDQDKMNWQSELKDVKNFPFKILPCVAKPGFKLADSVFISDRILNACAISVALGDLQCSFYSCAENKSDCVINISTSAQICMAVDKKRLANLKAKLPSSIAIFPYIGDRVLLVAASLNGGNVLDCFVEMLIGWNDELGFRHPNARTFEETKNLTWNKLFEISTDFLEIDSKLVCKPTLFGERHDSEAFASIHNIFADNTKLGAVFVSMCDGLVKNLTSMFPEDILIDDLGCQRIVATGSGVLRNPILKSQLQDCFKNLSVVFKESSDSAAGAAMFSRDQLKNIS